MKTSAIIPGLALPEINLRDFGGFPTKNGGGIKAGLLYRSGNLEKLSTENYQFISDLHIKTVIDFRSMEEQKKSPGNFPAIQKVSLPCNIDRISRNRLRPFLLRGSADDEIVAAICTVYEDMTDLMVEPIGRMIRIILEGGCPILIHCRAGKDRTGFAAAVIQRLMGVEEEIIIDEYLRSNEFMSPKINRAHKRLRLFTLGLLPKVNLQAAFEVRAQYLNTAFSVIDKKYGGLEGYLAAGGVSRGDLEALAGMVLL